MRGSRRFPGCSFADGDADVDADGDADAALNGWRWWSSPRVTQGLLPPWEQRILVEVRIISRRTLRQFWAQPGRGDSEQPLRAWFAEVERASWRTPADVKGSYRSASFVGSDRVVFNIGGNKYRLVVAIKYSAQIVFIRFVGTHHSYDRIDAAEV